VDWQSWLCLSGGRTKRAEVGPTAIDESEELKELIEFLIEKDIAEFELERGDVKVRIKRGSEAVASASAPDCALLYRTCGAASGCRTRHRRQHPPSHRPGPLRSLPRPRPRRELHIVRSPIVGHVLRVAFARIPALCESLATSVEAGQILCIVEAMKLMNEIESDVAGEIVKKLVANNAPIEYGQELFAIRPQK